MPVGQRTITVYRGTSDMKEIEVNNMNTAALAYMGDAVYEQAVRERLLKGGGVRVDRLQKTAAKRYVSAAAQARIIQVMFDELDEKEQFRVGRWKNYKPKSMPKNADIRAYRWATAFEAFLGYLHLTEKRDRLEWALERAFVIAEAEER